MPTFLLYSRRKQYVKEAKKKKKKKKKRGYVNINIAEISDEGVFKWTGEHACVYPVERLMMLNAVIKEWEPLC
ncbi:hypothetical protein F2P79_004903 [Pimephales promelas]|nr:hypothetical protein F2P79_004903 [Pimephales promelas]